MSTTRPPQNAPPEMLIAALAQVGPLEGLERGEYEWLARNGEEVRYAPGQSVYNPGDKAEWMMILLEGEIHVRRDPSSPAALFIGRSGHLTGLLPYSRMVSYPGQALAIQPTWALRLHRSKFDEMLAAIPSMSQRVVSVMLDRVREVTRIEQQAEKLTALGKLAANLAHELNNPASAAQRTAGNMLAELDTFGRAKFLLGTLCLDQPVIDRIVGWEHEVRVTCRNHRPTETTAQARREDEIAAWLEAHGVGQSWRVAPDLAEMGLSAECLEPLAGYLDGKAISIVLAQLASSLRAERMAETMLDATARIFDLISAIKAYSYMDQTPLQQVDVRQGLDNTLQMFQSRTRGIEIRREYPTELTPVSAYGRELNQIWTALIENALDAVGGPGDGKAQPARPKIRLVCREERDHLVVEVKDNGPGIDASIKDRIFEPFFTTKPPGGGLGLGLDTAMRVVRMHQGQLTAQSKPGETCFTVRLPIRQLQAY